ncbi:MAG: nucleotide sugar dehydrogenase, partial [Bacteroidales bacterium]|nr:nucleotide sugar dehydrogenase [Bacteroidales bacterium]
MKITIVGTGYVGLVTGTCFAEMGTDVCCVDVNMEKISALQRGIPPIYEQGLDELLKKNLQKGRISFTTSIEQGIEDSEVVFCAVGTPPDEDGSADLRYVLEVAREVGQYMKSYMLVVTKSTVPVGTAQKVRAAIQEELDKRGAKLTFDVASNPEFLKEGAAVKDFMYPDRIVVGVESEKAKEVMNRLYKPFTLNGHPVIFMDIASAEMTKYAANSMLATRISFMNDIANLCELVGADVDSVRKGMGKKKNEVLNELELKFLDGCETEKTLDRETAKNLWETFKKFAEYAFNKSHALAYSIVANQCAYLKANYTPEFLAASMSSNLNDTDQLAIFVDDAKTNFNIPIVAPDINGSESLFTVLDGKIIYGLAAIKGVGTAATDAIVAERNANGRFKNLTDFAKRCAPIMNKRILEAFAKTGVLDSLEPNRAAVYM